MTAPAATESGPFTRRTFLRAGLALAVTGAAAYGVHRWRLIPPDHDARRIDPATAQAEAAAGDLLLIDIRRPDEWASTGLGPDATPIDMRRDDFLAAVDTVTGGDRSAPVALICARGVRSAQMTLRLQEAGYTNITDIPEGMLGSAAGPGWLQRGLAVTPWTGNEP